MYVYASTCCHANVPHKFNYCFIHFSLVAYLLYHFSVVVLLFSLYGTALLYTCSALSASDPDEPVATKIIITLINIHFPEVLPPLLQLHLTSQRNPPSLSRTPLYFCIDFSVFGLHQRSLFFSPNFFFSQTSHLSFSYSRPPQFYFFPSRPCIILSFASSHIWDLQDSSYTSLFLSSTHSLTSSFHLVFSSLFIPGPAEPHPPVVLLTQSVPSSLPAARASLRTVLSASFSLSTNCCY